MWNGWIESPSYQEGAMQEMVLATQQGVVVYERDGAGWREARRGLAGRNVTSVIAREGVILAGTRQGVFRSDDLGESWQEASQGLSIPYVRWLAYHPEVSDREFAGTEPAGIFVSEDGARSWRLCEEVPRLRDKYKWFLPYSPEAGCVRGFAFHGGRAYAAVEVGGLLVSDDSGGSWQLAAGSHGEPDMRERPGYIHPDVHSIEVHPSSAELLFAPTGGGFYKSGDGGRSWEPIYPDCYVRAVWLDPADPQHLVLGPADNVDANGRIEESRDGGRTWTKASTGLDLPWRRHMVERFASDGERLFAVLSNGEVWSAPLASLEWQRALPQESDANALTWMAG
jgi:photosystem II stability/assembly factor-like uncharacterized protein